MDKLMQCGAWSIAPSMLPESVRLYWEDTYVVTLAVPGDAEQIRNLLDSYLQELELGG